jgi:hypothetical protein
MASAHSSAPAAWSRTAQRSLVGEGGALLPEVQAGAVEKLREHFRLQVSERCHTEASGWARMCSTHWNLPGSKARRTRRSHQPPAKRACN